MNDSEIIVELEENKKTPVKANIPFIKKKNKEEEIVLQEDNYSEHGPDEIDVLIDTVKPKKRNKVQIDKTGNPGDFEETTIIDISKIKGKISKSDTLLCIMELSLHGKQYGIKNSPTTLSFWNKVFELFGHIFTDYKPDTLRKYCRNLNEIADKRMIVRAITESKDVIDNPDVK
jgi:hypothetical protein